MTAEKVASGRGHIGGRSAQAEQFYTYASARTESAAAMLDPAAGCTGCESSPWECAAASRRRRLGWSVSKTPGHNGLR